MHAPHEPLDDTCEHEAPPPCEQPGHPPDPPGPHQGPLTLPPGPENSDGGPGTLASMQDWQPARERSDSALPVLFVPKTRQLCPPGCPEDAHLHQRVPAQLQAAILGLHGLLHGQQLQPEPLPLPPGQRAAHKEANSDASVIADTVLVTLSPPSQQLTRSASISPVNHRQ